MVIRRAANINAPTKNKDVEVLSESFFAIAFAIWKQRKKTKLKDLGGFVGEGSQWKYITTIAHVRKWFSDLGIGGIASQVLRDPEFKSRVQLCWSFLNGKGGIGGKVWGEIIPMQMNAFFSSSLTKIGGSYVAMRADMIPPAFNPYEVYKKVSKKVKQHRDFSEEINPNKWNPADVWIFSPVAIQTLKTFVTSANDRILNDPAYDVGYMNELNNKIYTLYKVGQLFPVSLKAPSGAIRIVQMNAEDMSYKQEVRYLNVEFDNNNVDVKLNFAVDLKKKNGRGGWKVETANYMEGRMKTKSATVTGFGSGGGSRLEIEITRPRGGARYGSLGTNIQEVVIEKTETSGIRELDKIRHGFPDLYRRFGWGASSGWHGRRAYEKALKEDPEGFINVIKPYTDALYRSLGPSGAVWDPPQKVLGNKPGVVYVSKTHAGEIGVAVDKIMRNFMKGVVLENLFNIASSQQVQTGTAQEQIKRRAAGLGKKLKGDLQKFPPAKADLIWKSSFHLVVK
tara:strand:- start:46 stop:1572 length:1527 start_codon:yes stop_codon:yes gene_type:complete